jgi:hypothetical protein
MLDGIMSVVSSGPWVLLLLLLRRDAFVGIFMYCNYLAAEIWRAAATT